MKSPVSCLMLILIVGRGLVAQAADETPAIRVTGCRVKPSDHATLSVNQSGILDSIPREGESVDAGTKVIRLEDELAKASLAVAEKEAENDVDIRYSEIASGVANLEYEQALKVNESVKGSVTAADLRRRKLEYDGSVLQIEQAKYKQSIAILKRNESAAQLKMFHVIAPFTGTVNKVLKHKGEAVRQGEPILELVNTQRVRVEGYLDVSHRRRVKPGTRVEVTPEQPSDAVAPAPIIGKIMFVDTIVQPVTQQVRIWAEVENPDEILLPGMTAVLSITTDAAPLANSR